MAEIHIREKKAGPHSFTELIHILVLILFCLGPLFHLKKRGEHSKLVSFLSMVTYFNVKISDTKYIYRAPLLPKINFS